VLSLIVGWSAAPFPGASVLASVSASSKGASELTHDHGEHGVQTVEFRPVADRLKRPAYLACVLKSATSDP
jgi:hypothetical protein